MQHAYSLAAHFAPYPVRAGALSWQAVFTPLGVNRRPSCSGFGFATPVTCMFSFHAHLQNDMWMSTLTSPLALPLIVRWQWLGVPALLLMAAALSLALGRISKRLLANLAGRTVSTWDDALVMNIGAPLSLVWFLLLVNLIAPWLGFAEPVQSMLDRLLRAGFWVAAFWGVSRAIDVSAQLVVVSTWATSHPASRSLIPLGLRIAKMTVAAMGVLAMLSGLGYPVTTILAGLGVGGIGIALASQKTVENLFGALSLGADQPFREGDFVRVDDCLGTVEAIGLRSTRIRTLDRTVVSIPNGKLAEMRVESFAARDRMRLACTIGLVYGTTAPQMRAILTSLHERLRAHPRIWPDNVIVRFKEFGDWSLNIEVMAWFQTSEWSDFQAIREELLLDFMEVVEAGGSSFAFPTRTIHLVPESTPVPRPQLDGEKTSRPQSPRAAPADPPRPLGAPGRTTS